MAEPSVASGRSAAQVAELVVSDLRVAGNLPDTRLHLETELRADVEENAVAICKVEAELNFEGTLMGRVKSVYSLYGLAGEEKVEIYRGMRGEPEAVQLALVQTGEVFTVKDNSFFFKLGPGDHELMFSMSARASSPQHAYVGFGRMGGAASLKANTSLRVE